MKNASHTGSTLKRLQALAIAASLLLAPGVAWARPDPAPAAGRPTSTARSLTDAETFERLERLEDEGLAGRRAAHFAHDHWSTGEIVLVVVLLIVFFPLGVIVLIVILLSHDH